MGKSQLCSHPTSKATPQTDMFLPRSKWKCLQARESAGNQLPSTQTQANIRRLKAAAQNFSRCYVSNRNFWEFFPLNSTKIW